jgi:hypothetical protein
MAGPPSKTTKIDGAEQTNARGDDQADLNIFVLTEPARRGDRS